jgi:hypothetical protein
LKEEEQEKRTHLTEVGSLDSLGTLALTGGGDLKVDASREAIAQVRLRVTRDGSEWDNAM